MKPYGFYIHGCVDGHSRKVIWLRLVPSNNDPFVIAQIFSECCREAGGIPARVRSDCGTENVIVAGAQSYLRRHDDDEHAGLRAHIYGPSTGNQRIEAWWSIFRRVRSTDIISYFRDLADSGEFNAADEFQVYLLRYCFADLVRRELHDMVEYWNAHRIRASQYARVSGHPNILYALPHLVNAEDQLHDFNEEDFELVERHISENNTERDMIDPEYYNYFQDVSSQIDSRSPTTWNEAKELYRTIMSFQ